VTDIYGYSETLPVVRETIYRAQNDDSLLLNSMYRQGLQGKKETENERTNNK
jgi:hypothetical protein